LPVAIVGEGALGAGHHVGRVALDGRGVEDGRHHLALLAPELARAGEQALAGQRVEREARHRRLLEEPRPLDQQLGEHLGIVDHGDAPERGAEPHERPAVFGEARHEAQAILADLGHVAEDGVPAAQHGELFEAHAPKVACARRAERGRRVSGE
jgi:hypothetical protein